MTNFALRNRPGFHAALVAAAILASSVFALPVMAQSESDLRRQNQELTTRVRELETELEAARRQNEALQRRIAALEAQLAAARSGAGRTAADAPEEPKTTIDESKPNATPRAMFAAIQQSYADAVVDTPMGQAGDRERIAYMRKLDKWRASAEREFRSQVEWHVRIKHDSVSANPARNVYTFIAVDPVTDAQLGDEFNITLSRALALRLVDQEGRGERGLLVLKGTVVPAIRINAQRDARGSFDNPRFIGPFAEFAFTVDPSSIVAYRPAPEKSAPEAPTSG